jgi:hypothetical protein
MVILASSLSLSGEKLYRAILAHFGLQVLTQKALDYLRFIETKLL